MRTEIEIISRIEVLRQNLAIIEQKAREELSKPFDDRSQRTMYFLFQEKKVWECALMQLKWILGHQENSI